jgi:CheY-like chemotaxis protein
MLTIVVVEDDLLIREALALSLADGLGDCRVLKAPDGRAAADFLQQERVDLVVTDLAMPELDGYGLIEHRNRFFPKIPVVVMTGDASPAVLGRLKALGVEECLEKPFDHSAAVRMVRSSLNRSPQTGAVGRSARSSLLTSCL